MIDFTSRNIYLKYVGHEQNESMCTRDWLYKLVGLTDSNELIILNLDNEFCIVDETKFTVHLSDIVFHLPNPSLCCIRSLVIDQINF